MTTSNHHDLASFEPEAILASLPGEHPKMASALAIGRQASEGGQLDVDALSRIVGEIYDGGLPTSFAGASGFQPAEIPSTASLTHAVSPELININAPASLSAGSLTSFAQGGVPPALPPTAELPGASGNNYPGYAKQTENVVGEVHARQLEYASGVPYGQGAITPLDVSQLFGHMSGGLGIPQTSELQGLFGTGGVPGSAAQAVPLTVPGSTGHNPNVHNASGHYPVPGHGVSSAASGNPAGGQYYFSGQCAICVATSAGCRF